jgi:spore coat protein U-like protein
VSVAPLNFGSSISPGGIAVTIKSATAISVNCSVGTKFVLLLGEGSNAIGSGFGAVRRLAGAGGYLPYGLFQDGARTMPWGDGMNVGNGEAGSGNAGAEPFIVFSSLSIPATAVGGSYSDSVLVTVSF